MRFLREQWFWIVLPMLVVGALVAFGLLYEGEGASSMTYPI